VRLLIVALLLWLVAVLYGQVRPLPEGLSVRGEIFPVSSVEFLYDLTFARDGELRREQRIFERMCRLIEEAEQFVLLDLFLFNSMHGSARDYPPLAASLTARLIEKKRVAPQVDVVLITDEINRNYGAFEPDHFAKLRAKGVRVVYTDTRRLRDSNFFYSSLWRLLGQWISGEGAGWLPNPFAARGPEMTLGSYLRLMNFKANHRKVAVNEKEALITSANPHDASAYHSNIALVGRGGIVREIIASERAVAHFSGLDFPEWPIAAPKGSGPIGIQLLTEGKIKESLLANLARCGKGGSVRMAMFYLSDRDIINALLAVAERGAEVRIVLDSNSEAFGRAKSGIPNRPVAAELLRRSGGKIDLRWYASRGEQFHSKLTMISFPGQSLIIAGSANLTRRNLDDFNLESCFAVHAPSDAEVVGAVASYFDRIWRNTDGDYSHDAQKYAMVSPFCQALYRFQEWSGLSTF